MNVLVDKSSKLQVTFDPADRGFVYAVVRRIAETDAEADDITQDALLLAFRHRAAFRGESHYRTWLYRIAATTALGYKRKHKRSRERLAPTEQALAIDLADPAPSPESVVAHTELASLVQELVDGLDPKYRDVVIARFDATEVETATELGISLANVKVRAHRARKQLRAAIEQLVTVAA